MRKRAIRIISCILAALFVLSAAYMIFASVAYAAEAARRDETVYVDMDGDGNITGVISSVYLGNSTGADTLTDHSSLADVKNVSGLESPEISGDVLTFAADGEDVIYQGNGDAANLPFSISISYTLNGRPVEAAELAGQSGRLGITVKTANNEKRTVEVDGEEVEMYVPFTIVCMYTFDETFTNIETSGKLTSQAGSNSVMGLLMPGLRESLNDLENDSIQDTLTIEAEVENLSLPSASIIGIVGLVDESDLSGLDDVQTMIDGLDDMESATKELRDGAKELRDGSREFTDGVLEFADGSQELTDGAVSLVEGAAELTDGIGASYDGVDQLYSQLGSALSGLGGAGGDTGAGEGGGGTETGSILAPEDIETIKAALMTAGNENAEAIIAKLTNSLTALAAASAALEEIAATQTEMAGRLQQLYEGVGQLRSGLAQLYSGSGELTMGMYDLASGSQELTDGALELADGAVELTDGIDGLYDGLQEFHREGMQELVDETSSISVSLSRKDALLALSDSYNSFSSTEAVSTGSVQFVFTVEAIEPELPIETPAPEEAVPATAETEEPGFFQRVADWFKGLFS